MNLPLRINRRSESYKVQDASGDAVVYVYFENEPTRRSTTRRVTEAEAREIAKVVARALTDAVEAGRLS